MITTNETLGYNLNAFGEITEFGYDPNNKYKCLGSEPWLGDDIRRWKLVDGEWVKLGDEEFENKYGPQEP